MLEDFTPKGKDYFEWLKEWSKSIFVKISLVGAPFAFGTCLWDDSVGIAEDGLLYKLLMIPLIPYDIATMIAIGGAVMPVVSSTGYSTLSVTSGGPSEGGRKEGELTIDGRTYDVYSKSVIPYSRVEKTALQISNVLNHEMGSGFPVVITESQEAYQAASSFFGHSVSGTLDTLEVLERALQR